MLLLHLRHIKRIVHRCILACVCSIGSVYVAGETEDDAEPAASGGAGGPSSTSGAAMTTPRITATWDRSYVPRTRRYATIMYHCDDAKSA